VRVWSLLLLAAAVSAAGPLHLDVKERTFENGLRVLVLEDRDIPNVALYTLWKVGSRNERPGITGLAHFFEHMMFRGGARFGANFDTVMEAAGGSNNAYTTRDVTVYQDWFPRDALPLILDMEADRMSGMVFRPETVASERGVVASERRLDLEEPAEAVDEQLWAAAYMAHPYQWPVLGWMSDIENWRQSDLEEFFKANYSPDHATMVVVGDVSADEVFRLVGEKMGGIPRGPERRPIHTREPEQTGERRIIVHHPGAELGELAMAWHIPETSHPDFPVLDVIERILLAGESSRLYRLLVEGEQLGLDVGGGWQGYQFTPSLFAVVLPLREGASAARAEDLVASELARLARDGPSERELEKAKNGLRADLVRQLQTIDGKAELLAETDAFFGGWQNLPARVEALAKVTPADVKRVAAAYFRKDNRTVAVLEPEAK